MLVSLVFILCQIAYIFSVPKIILTGQVTTSAIGKDQVCAFPLSFARQCFLHFPNNLLSPQTNLFIIRKHDSFCVHALLYLIIHTILRYFFLRRYALKWFCVMETGIKYTLYNFLCFLLAYVSDT